MGNQDDVVSNDSAQLLSSQPVVSNMCTLSKVTSTLTYYTYFINGLRGNICDVIVSDTSGKNFALFSSTVSGPSRDCEN